MQHRNLDDLTLEERDPRNQEIVAFLERAYLPIPQDVQPSEQTLARMRRRLSSTIEAEVRGSKPMLRVIRGTGTRDSGIGERHSTKQRLTLLAIAAILVAVVGSSLAVFHSMSMRGDMVARDHATATSSITPQEQALALVEQLKSEAKRWGEAYPYFNPGDHKSYMPNTSYLEQSVLIQELEARLMNARTDNDFSQIANRANEALFLLHAFEREAEDQTAYNQPHQEDISLLDHFQLKQGNVIVISTAQQSLRFYQDGRLIKGFLVTAGSVNVPLAVGMQSILLREQNMSFVSPESQDNPNWYAPTTVKYALQFHSGGYMIFDAAWNKNFGPGSQFPQAGAEKHPSGVWMNLVDMQWLYEHTNMQTQVIVY